MGGRRARRRVMRGDDLRTALSTRLPARLHDVLQDYEAFAAGAPPPADAKGYATHHAACKAVLQHADMLVRLLRWAESGAGNGTGADDAGEDLARLLARARAAVADGEGDDEEGEEDKNDR